MSTGIELLRLDAATSFVLSRGGRIVRENDPERSPGPRVFFSGCDEGNLTYVRADLAEPLASEVIGLLAAEPPWSRAEARPACLGNVVEAISALDGPAPAVETSLIYRLPRCPPSGGAVPFVCSGTEGGDALLAHLRHQGMPPHLHDAGFARVGDFWPPWCVALEGETIAAIAFAARLSTRGAAVGVYTFPQFRSRGLAAAVTARWSALPDLAARALFYSTSVTNLSSLAVTRRLGLPRIGQGLRIG